MNQKPDAENQNSTYQKYRYLNIHFLNSILNIISSQNIKNIPTTLVKKINFISAATLNNNLQLVIENKKSCK